MQYHPLILQSSHMIIVTKLPDHMENDIMIYFFKSCQQTVKTMPRIKITGYKQPFLALCSAVFRNRRTIQNPIRVNMTDATPSAHTL